MRRVAAARGPMAGGSEERWASNGLKPFFNDFVVHKGHAYGFDGTHPRGHRCRRRRRKWKGGRYGNGQLVLLADQDLLLVITEDGDLALVSATPDSFNEVAPRVPRHRRQDVEPSRAGRRRAARAQRRGDGRVPTGAAHPVTGNWEPSTSN